MPEVCRYAIPVVPRKLKAAAAVRVIAEQIAKESYGCSLMQCMHQSR